jgi:hypothetical protein
MIKTQYNRKEHDKTGEINNQPSCTIPDQSISIPEMISRYTRGLPLGAGIRTPYYDDEPEKDILQGRPFASLDLSEQHELTNISIQEYNETIQRLRNQQPSNTETVQTQQSHSTEETH